MTAADDLRALIDLADSDEDGAPCSEALRNALQVAMARRAGPDAPALPALGPLVVRRTGLPDWWTRDNLLLAGPEAETVLITGLDPVVRSGNVGVIGRGSVIGRFTFESCDGLIVVGDAVRMVVADLAARDGGAILVGEETSATSWARLDARNGGAILVGADGMWGEDVNLITDDMHAIRDLQTGRRTNRYGGRIVVERHVWLSDAVRLVAGAHVGENSVVGLSAYVRDALPAGSVCVGWPARPIRQGVTWTREDLP